MSIASEITRIQNAKSALKTSINAKTDQSHQITNETIDDYSSFVDSITGGTHTGAYKVDSVAEMNAIDDMQNGDYCIVDGSRLPSEYQEVEYLQSTGTQYIDTGVKPYKTKTEIQFQQPSVHNTQMYVAGCWNPNNNRYNIVLFDSSHKFVTSSRLGNDWTTLSSYNSNVNTIIYNDENNKVKFNNNNKMTVSDLTTTVNNSIYLFAQCDEGIAKSFFIGRIFYCKITDKDTGNLVRNMIPCYRKSDNIVGMYNTVNDVFYTNSGTGAFEKGANTNAYFVYQYNGTSWVEV